jgi:tetratricopeptide (TPR) repeat protein
MILRRLCVTRIEISLREGYRSLRFLVVVGCISLFMAAETALVGVTSSFKTPSEGRLIMAFDPNDPRAEYRLGQAYQDTDSAESIRHLRRATELSPYSRLYWSELASGCESVGDTQCADQATERLLKLCPMVPLYHWQAAQSYLRRNRLDLSLAQFRRLLQLDPAYAWVTWGSLQTVGQPELIFRKVLADREDSEIKVGYVDFLSTQEDYNAAYRIWRLVVTNARPFPFSSAEAYLDRLIALGRIEEAVHVWQDLARLGIIERPKVDEKDGLIFNSDFEQPPLNAAFDWRSSQVAYLHVDFSASGAYHGTHCLRVDFTAARNNEYEPVYQIVPVLPNHRYALAAYVRSEDITSGSGPCLRVRDTKQPSFQDATSETTVGTTNWHPVRLWFSARAETRSIRLSIWRPLGRAFPMDISGSFWLDAVSLTCTDCAVEKDALEGQY